MTQKPDSNRSESYRTRCNQLFLTVDIKRILKTRAVRGSLWTFTGYGAQQILRFGGNLIMTRLLFPEAFGVMALVNVFLQGIGMFSDFGLQPSIIQNKQGEESSFLRTAWTIQIGRGIVLCSITAVLAIPIANFYKEPSLRWFIPVAGINFFTTGLASANLALANRRLEISKLTIIDLSSQITSLIVMIIWAWQYRTIWALIAGGIIGPFTKTILSHVILSGPKMRTEFHPEYARELFVFGKWIFLATVQTFIANQIDRVVLGKFMTMGELGVYSVAFALSNVMPEITRAISGKVLFPLYSETARNNIQGLRAQTYKYRGLLIIATLPPLWILIIWGPEIIGFLYDDRYRAAGWIVQVLGCGSLLNTILFPINSVFLATGSSLQHLVNLLFRSGILLCSMFIGGWFLGTKGIIIGMVVAPIAFYPILVIQIRRYNVWLPQLDLSGFAVSALIISLGIWMK